MSALAGLIAILLFVGAVGAGLCILEKLVTRILNRLDFHRSLARWKGAA